jgi:hypothetical protein
MKKLALLALVGGALFATNGAASAQYYSGTGYGVYIGPRYDRDYDEPRYQRRYDERRGYGDRGGIVGENSYGRRELYYRVAPGGRCPARYTVQDGLCKPYRGY